MEAIAVLGRIEVPAEVSDIVAPAQADWNNKGRPRWERTQRRPWQGAEDRSYLDESTVEFVSRTLRAFGVEDYDPYGHSLLLFGNVEQHTDGRESWNGRPAGFFHLILSGSGTLRLPGLRDQRSRELELSKGTAFWFNPRVSHLVENSSDDGLSSLTATIGIPRSARSGRPS